ncbi:hypothetical protein M514_09016 [Trichuris suis]|uniref:Copia protein n=1 Tax=Trichuris suis TaxID=68888 RepID=A0A085LYL0_9BILA|nr:hypothetical protein M513_09016 [Trichuris suis]KFD62528.1 hypothetical protein M514_09016 [Trichuris suis]
MLLPWKLSESYNGLGSCTQIWRSVWIGPMKIYKDYQGCIKVAQSDRCSQRTKHIDVRHHQLRDLYESGIVSLIYCPSSEMLADVLTKPLDKDKFDHHLKQLGLQ